MSEAIFEFKNPYTGTILPGKNMRIEPSRDKAGMMLVIIEVQYAQTGPCDVPFIQDEWNEAQLEWKREKEAKDIVGWKRRVKL